MTHTAEVAEHYKALLRALFDVDIKSESDNTIILSKDDYKVEEDVKEIDYEI